MRVSKIKNVKIDNSFKNIGKAVERLTEQEYDELEKKYKLIKSYIKPIKFDAITDIILAKLPDNKIPVEKVMKDGTAMWSVPVIFHDGTWSSFLTDEEEADGIKTYMGCKIVIVGKIIINTGAEGTKNAGKTYRNINKYRGCLIPDGEAEEEDDI